MYGDAPGTADKSWAEGNKIGERLSVSSEEVQRFLPTKNRVGHVTIREDLQVFFDRR